jgi:VanZ family protein
MRMTLLRGLAWLLLAAIAVLSLVPPLLRPVTEMPHTFEHFGIFALCGWAYGTGYRSGHLFQAAALVVFCGLIELLQLMVPGRHARMIDFVVDAAASCVGVLFGLVTVKFISVGRPVSG